MPKVPRSRLRDLEDRVAGRKRVMTDPAWGRLAAKARELRREKRRDGRNFVVIYDYAGADLMVLKSGPFWRHLPLYLAANVLLFSPIAIPLGLFVTPLAALAAPLPALAVAGYFTWRRVRPVQLLAMRKYRSYVLYHRDPHHPIGYGMIRELSISVTTGAIFDEALVFSSPDFRCEKFRVSRADEEKIQTYKRRVGIRD
jgi:hypothetical protein